MQIRELIPWSRKEGRGQGDDHPLALLQRDINHLFDDFWRRFGAPDFGAASEAKSDIVETGDAVEFSIELPGMDEKDIELTVSDNALTIRGEKKLERQEEKKGYYLSERSYGLIHRSLPLPPGVDTAKAEARFKNGVLTVRLPLSPEAKTKAKKLEIKSG